MRIPRWLLRHEFTIEEYLGSGANGPLYGPARTVRCFLDAGRKTVRDSEGREVVSTATAYCDLGEAVAVEDRITVAGCQREVVTVKDRDGAGLATPDHQEIAFK